MVVTESVALRGESVAGILDSKKGQKTQYRGTPGTEPAALLSFQYFIKAGGGGCPGALFPP